MHIGRTVPPTRTETSGSKPEPVRVTSVPPRLGPEAGASAVTCGQLQAVSIIKVDAVTARLSIWIDD